MSVTALTLTGLLTIREEQPAAPQTGEGELRDGRPDGDQETAPPEPPGPHLLPPDSPLTAGAPGHQGGRQQVSSTGNGPRPSSEIFLVGFSPADDVTPSSPSLIVPSSSSQIFFSLLISSSFGGHGQVLAILLFLALTHFLYSLRMIRTQSEAPNELMHLQHNGLTGHQDTTRCHF